VKVGRARLIASAEALVKFPLDDNGYFRGRARNTFAPFLCWRRNIIHIPGGLFWSIALGDEFLCGRDVPWRQKQIAPRYITVVVVLGWLFGLIMAAAAATLLADNVSIRLDVN